MLRSFFDQPLEDQRLTGFAVPVASCQHCQREMSARATRIARPERVGLLVGEVLRDRGRSSEHEIAVDQCRGATRGIEREIVRRALLALGQIDQLQLERQPEMGGDGATFQVFGGRRKSIELMIASLDQSRKYGLLVSPGSGNEPRKLSSEPVQPC